MRIDFVLVGISYHHRRYGNFVAYALAQAAQAQASEPGIPLRLCIHFDADEVAAMFSQKAGYLDYLIFVLALFRGGELDSYRLLIRPVLACSVEYLKWETCAFLQVVVVEVAASVMRKKLEKQAASREIQR